MLNTQNQIQQISEYLRDLSPTISQMLKDGFWKIAKSEFLDGRQDVSTKVDHEIGQFISDKLFAKFTDIVIDSEEIEERRGEGNITVRIDPLDGSKHAVCGMELISTIISVVYGSQTYFCTIINPFPDKYYYAFKGEGAYLNDKKIEVNSLSIADNFVLLEQPTSPLYEKDAELFKKYSHITDLLMKNSYRLRNVGLASLSVGWIAEGSACAYIDLSGTTKLYDIEGPLLIAQEAGAMIGTIDGKMLQKVTFDPESEKKYIYENLIIANPTAFKELTELLK